MHFSIDQIHQLSPDASSIKAAQGLTAPKWVLLEYNDNAMWGLCQGSGKNPYQTIIDLTELAYKCSCPSRKFPCKHSLALMLLSVQQADKFQQQQNYPDWVSAWLEKRQQNQAAKQAKVEQASKEVDVKARQKRQQARHNKALQGIMELQQWLQDLLRNGLIQAEQNKTHLFPTMAKRMIDNQLPALATELQQFVDLPFNQPTQFLYRLSKLFLLCETYQNATALSADWQAEIQTRLGFPISKENVLSQPAFLDIWLNIGVTITEQERIKTHCYWLYGLASQRFAYILDFIVAGAPKQMASVLLGQSYAGELCFYAGVENQRALAKQWEIAPLPELSFKPITLSQAWQQVQQSYQRNPFLIQLPMCISPVRIVWQEAQFALTDGEHILPLTLTENPPLNLLAHTEGQPFTAFVLYECNMQEYHLLSAVNYQGQLMHFTSESNEGR